MTRLPAITVEGCRPLRRCARDLGGAYGDLSAGHPIECDETLRLEIEVQRAEARPRLHGEDAQRTTCDRRLRTRRADGDAARRVPHDPCTSVSSPSSRTARPFHCLYDSAAQANARALGPDRGGQRSEEHTSEL